MGCSQSRRRRFGNLTPNERLARIINNADPKTEYLHWHECVDDFLCSYNNHVFNIRLDINILVFFNNGKTMQIVHSIPYYGIIDVGAFRFIRNGMYAFMGAPYIYINNRIHFLDNVYNTKFNCIKSFWIL